MAQCQSCGQDFELNYMHCPSCGGQMSPSRWIEDGIKAVHEQEMAEKAEQAENQSIERAFGILGSQYPNIGDKYSNINAACCVALRDGKVVTAPSQEAWLAYDTSGSASYMGQWRKYIHKHPKLNSVNGKHRSGDAELKILDWIQEDCPDRDYGLIICMMTSEKPCPACANAIYEFCKSNRCKIVVRFKGTEKTWDRRQ